MSHGMWSARILLKYALIQLPGIAILLIILVLAGQWIEIPSWVRWGLIGLWLAVDIVGYPFVWRAYDWGRDNDNHPMIGLTGTAKDRLDPSGYVFVRGELWEAHVMRSQGPIEVGEKVVVCGIKGLILFVQAADKN